MLDQKISKQVKAYCTKIGADPLLVQGAGGNVSWKDGEVLWVKASGTWLAHAENEEIFIPVDLAHLRAEISEENFSSTPKVLANTSLKPSIETMLHALMPHKIVVHLHAVEILAHLVRKNPLEDLRRLIGDVVDWVFVDYCKPGAYLASAVRKSLQEKPDANIVFLKSHGLVIGGDSIHEINCALNRILKPLRTPVGEVKTEVRAMHVDLDASLTYNGYRPCDDLEIHFLANRYEFSSRLKSEWALYPDHVVFLGSEPTIIEDLNVDGYFNKSLNCRPLFIFILNVGVYEFRSVRHAHRLQLRCYFDVLARQPEFIELASMSKSQISELLDWEAEKYRQAL